jgi:hypothetical protein
VQNAHIGLALALVSAVAVNWAYTQEHDAASVMPPFSAHHPRRFVASLLGSRSWLLGFGTESAGWLVYVAALRLAPLSLVQAVSASGIAVLAVASAHGHPGRLAHREKAAVGLAVAGLALLALSLVGTHQVDRAPAWEAAAVWLGACAAGAVALGVLRVPLARGAALGLGAGLFFASGDMSAKLVVYGGWWLVTFVPLVACYALGTSFLQTGFQHSDALTTAGLATLATNAVPIAAGFVIFGERLPHGEKGALQLAAFGCLVASAVFLGRSARGATRAGAASAV